MKHPVYWALFKAYSRSRKKKISFVETSANLSETIIPRLGGAYVVTSPSAWAQFLDLYPTCPTPPTVILNPSIEITSINTMAASIQENLIVGIGGGRIMDATKALAKMAKTKNICILIPSILSTTAWLNPTASLKKGSHVYHAKGKYDQIIIDCPLIAAAPSHLNFGVLSPLLS